MTRYTSTHNLPYPEGADSVAPATRDFRDLALNTDAALTQVQAAATEDAVEQAAWYKGATSLTDNDHVDDLPFGVFTVWGGSLATAIGFPVGISSAIEVVPFGALVMQRVTAVGPDPQVWQRVKLSSGWQPWQRIDAGSIVVPDQPDPTGQAGLRLAPIALTTSTGSGTEIRAAQAVRFPLHYAPQIRRWRVHVANYNDVTGASGNAVTLTGLWVGAGWDGTFTATPSKVSDGGTVPAGGGEWVSKWITTPIGGGQQMMLSAGLSGATDTNIITPGGAWRNTSGGGEATAGSASGSGYTVSVWAPLNWWIEAELDSDVPVIAGWGDSNTAGTGTTLPVNDSWLSQYARTVGAIPMHVAYPGTAMSQWSSGSDRRWARFDGFKADAVIHFMGQNDIAGVTTLAEMQTRYNDTVELLKAKVSPSLYLATITPSGGKTEPQNVVRRQYETWLRNLPGGARDLFEFGQAISTDDTTIAAPYDSGDQLHFNTSGHAALAAAITRPVAGAGTPQVFQAKAGPITQWKDAAGTVVAQVEQDGTFTGKQQDTGWRSIPRISGTGGTVLLRRIGQTVHASIVSYRPAALGTSVLADLPAGFRPKYLSLTWAEEDNNARPLYIFPAASARLELRAAGRVGSYVSSSGVWLTDDPWPATLPGSPA